MEVRKAGVEAPEKHTQYTKNKKQQTPNFFLKMVGIWRTENLIDYVLTDLEKRVKRDKATKQSVFSTALSAYLPEPINTFLKGRSGIGKTYNVVETLRYFPSEDVWFLGGLSPKALIHDHGILLDEYGDPVDFSRKPEKPKKGKKTDEEYEEAKSEYYKELTEWREYIGKSYTLIDLSHKILVFLEAPEFKTFRMLFPILSHDTEKIEYKFTDKTSGGKLSTSKVVIQGWPATIFLSTDIKYIEELATRSFTTTPEASQDKIKEANELTNLKVNYPWRYNHETEETQFIKKLIVSLKGYFAERGLDVVVPFTNLHDLFPKEIVRDMRDFQHFTQFLKTITALHLFQRITMEINDKRFVLSTVEDVKNAFEVYKEIFETTRTGMDQQVLSFYDETVKGAKEEFLKQLTQKYNTQHPEKKVSGETVRRWLERLSDIGYVDAQKSDVDKRFNVYTGLVEELSTIRHIPEMWTSPSAELEKGFKTWFKTIYTQAQFYYEKNLDAKRHGEQKITRQEVEKVVLHGEKDFAFDSPVVYINSKEESKPTTEKKPEIIPIPKMRIIVDNSMFQCQVCEQTGKPMFFANEHDLQLHVERLHNNNPDYGAD